MKEKSKLDHSNSYLWCDACRRSFRHEDAPDGRCPICQGEMRPTGKMNAILSGFMANELVSSDLRTKHRQLVRMIWTRNSMGEQYYRVLAPNMPYNRFEARVTDLLCQGARDGWVKFIIPPAPTGDESEYRMEFVDESRFIAELEAIASSAGKT
jgi:hypothetical protein